MSDDEVSAAIKIMAEGWELAPEQIRKSCDRYDAIEERVEKAAIAPEDVDLDSLHADIKQATMGDYY